MAFVVELAEDQLAVGPIHRTLRGLPEGTDLPKVLGRWFDVVHAGPASDRVVGALDASSSLALVTADDALAAHPPPRDLRGGRRATSTRTSLTWPDRSCRRTS